MYSFKLYTAGEADNAQMPSAVDNEELSLRMYKLLESAKESILSKTDEFTLEDLWYSQYYWFLIIMKERDVMQQADYLQQLSKILDSMDGEFCIDWEIVERLEKDVYNNI